MNIKWVLLAGILSIAATEQPRVAIRIQSSSIVCSVPRNVDNRYITIGIEGYERHGISMNGEAAQITFQVPIKRLGCDPIEPLKAFCELKYAPEGVAYVSSLMVCRE